MDWLGTLLTLLGLYFNIRKNLLCWPIWVVGAVVWIIYGVASRQFSIAILYAVLAAFDFKAV